MKIFENVVLLFDIKDFLQQINPLNNDSLKKGMKLPPIQNAEVMEFPKLSYVKSKLHSKEARFNVGV